MREHTGNEGNMQKYTEISREKHAKVIFANPLIS